MIEGFLQQIKNLIGSSDDAAALNTTLFAGQEANANAITAIAGEVEKIPKSDGTRSFNSVALTAIQTRVSTAITAAALATAAELAKVPKSDGSVSWNATALAAIQSACEAAITATGGNRAEYKEYSGSTSSSSYVTAVSVTGSGRLYAIWGENSGVRVTVDSVVHEQAQATEIRAILTDGNLAFIGSSLNNGGLVIEFKNSLLIEFKTATTGSLKVAYATDV